MYAQVQEAIACIYRYAEGACAQGDIYSQYAGNLRHSSNGVYCMASIFVGDDGCDAASHTQEHSLGILHPLNP